MREIRANPETDKVYAASMDGTQVEHWIADLCAAFKKPMDVTTVWGLSTCESAFLRGVTKTFKECSTDCTADYAQLVLALPALKHWATAMRLGMHMKPAPEEYDMVKREMAIYVAEKMLLWPGSNTWYDNECLFHMGEMHERWGSLRLVSQEGTGALPTCPTPA